MTYFGINMSHIWSPYMCRFLYLWKLVRGTSILTCLCDCIILLKCMCTSYMHYTCIFKLAHVRYKGKHTRAQNANFDSSCINRSSWTCRTRQDDDNFIFCLNISLEILSYKQNIFYFVHQSPEFAGNSVCKSCIPNDS